MLKEWAISKIHVAGNAFQDFFARFVFTRIYTKYSLLVLGTVSVKNPNPSNEVFQLYQFLPSSPLQAPFFHHEKCPVRCFFKIQTFIMVVYFSKLKTEETGNIKTNTAFYSLM